MKYVNKITSTFSAVALLALVATPALAETAVRAEIKTDRQVMRADVKGKVETMRASTTVERAALKADIKGKIAGMKGQSSTTKMLTKEQIDAEREAYKKTLDAKRVSMKAEIKKEIENFKADKKVKLEAAKKDEVKKRLSVAFTKLSGAIGKLTGFDSRVSAAIGARKAKGLDTSAAESALVTARQALDNAKVSLEAVNVNVTASIDSTGGSSKGAIKEVILKAQDAIKTARTKYEEVIKALPEVKVTATTTAK